MTKVVFLNDYTILNERYRADLIKSTASNFDTLSLGFIDKPFLFILIFIENLFFCKNIILSSNLRANLVSLLILRGRRILILNGMGRYRDSVYFRKFFLVLVTVNPNVRFCVQNFSDFRYLRRFSRTRKIEWVVGSGGSVRQHSKSKGVLLVQRDDKIALVSKSVLDFLFKGNFSGPFRIVGCQSNSLLRSAFPGVNLESLGYLQQSDILLNGDLFLQPSGYGEGFPHTLADAIVSRMEVAISDEAYTRFGLYCLGFKRKELGGGWSRLITDEAMSEKLTLNFVTSLLVSRISNVES